MKKESLAQANSITLRISELNSFLQSDQLNDAETIKRQDSKITFPRVSLNGPWWSSLPDSYAKDFSESIYLIRQMTMAKMRAEISELESYLEKL